MVASGQGELDGPWEENWWTMVLLPRTGMGFKNNLQECLRHQPIWRGNKAAHSWVEPKPPNLYMGSSMSWLLPSPNLPHISLLLTHYIPATLILHLVLLHAKLFPAWGTLPLLFPCLEQHPLLNYPWLAPPLPIGLHSNVDFLREGFTLKPSILKDELLLPSGTITTTSDCLSHHPTDSFTSFIKTRNYLVHISASLSSLPSTKTHTSQEQG